MRKNLNFHHSYNPKMSKRIGEKNAQLIYEKNCKVDDEETKPFN